MNLKILSWNIWGGRHLPEILKFLEKSDADIIGLQEVIQDIDGSNNLAKIIAEKLNYKWVYYSKGQTDFYGSPREWGNAILSKYDIISSKSHNLYNGEDNRIAIEAEIKIQDKSIKIFTTHLIHTHQMPSKIQEEQAYNLLKVIPESKGVLVGDFNATPDSMAIEAIKKVMRNADSQSYPTWSVYPDGCVHCNPEGIDICLDYIFTTNDIKTHSYKVENSKGADHLPVSVIAEI